MNFEQALQALKAGQMVKREGWAGSKFIQLQTPTETSKMTVPYVFMVIQNAEGVAPTLVPWLCSQTDLLAEDWIQL